jgi:hypothetical protein
MRGRRIRLSTMRRFVGDLVHAARTIPSIPVQRRLHIGAVVAARALCAVRPPWPVIFMKAFAQVAESTPALRQAYVKFPVPHLYEYPVSVASIAVEREYLGEKVVLIGKVKDPASVSLAKLTQILRSYLETPLEEIKDFQRIQSVSALPWPLRRALWWLAMNLGRQRGNFLGTFGISVYSSTGAESLHPLSPTTTLLNYDRIGDDGTVNVRLVYDHRVMDGASVSRVLTNLETQFAGAILTELLNLAGTLPETGPPLYKKAI